MTCITTTYGRTVDTYLDFGVMITIFNVILLLVQSFNYIPHLIIDWYHMKDIAPSNGYIFPYILTSGYTGSMVHIWRISNIICIVVTFIIPIAYTIYSRVGIPTPSINDVIDSNTKITNTSRLLRIAATYSVYILVLCITTSITAGLTAVQGYIYMSDIVGTNTYVIYMAMSIVIGVVLYLINIIWNYMNAYLTRLERHKTYSAENSSYMFKLMSFRIINSWFTMLVRIVTDTSCSLEISGISYLGIIMIDIVFNNTAEIAVPLVRICMSMSKSELDIAEEYYELIYRQFIIYMGMTAFPYITLLGVCASVLELVVDRCKLRIHTIRKGSVNTSSIILGLCMATILAAIHPATGSVYSVVGYYWCISGTCSKCTIFGR